MSTPISGDLREAPKSHHKILRPDPVDARLDGNIGAAGVKFGTLRWTKEDFGCGSIILADGKLILLTESGDLVLAEPSPDAYHEKARASLLTGPCRAELALANGRLYRRDNKKLVCWDLRAK